MIALFVWGFLLGQEAPPTVPESGASVVLQEGREPGAADVAPVPQPPAIAPRDFDELEALLRDLERSHPECAKLESIGRSDGGREIYVLTISAPAGGGADAKPGFLVFDPGTEIAAARASFPLAVARRLCEATDAQLTDLLGHATFYLAPALDPDILGPAQARDGAEEPGGGVDYELNFPLGWRPASLRPGAGDFPLARGATQAAARFFAAHPNLVMVWGPCPPAYPTTFQSDFDLPELDRRVLDALAGEAHAAAEQVGWNPLTSAGGGSLDYAYQAHGIFALGSCVVDGSTAAEQRAERALLLAMRLPRLGLERTGLTRAGPNLWQLDVSLRNLGALPTMSALGLARRGDGALAVTLTGARLVACAARRVGEPEFALATHPEGATGIAIEGLNGGERRAIRMVFEAESGVEVRVSVTGAWVAGEELMTLIP